MSVPKSIGAGLRHQKQPFLRQHFLKRLPEPQGQRSFRPSLSSSSLSPCTTRTPRFTCVSDGNPRRRLLIVSKKWLFVEMFVICVSHGAPSFLVFVFHERHSDSQKVRFGELINLWACFTLPTIQPTTTSMHLSVWNATTSRQHEGRVFVLPRSF